MCAREYRYLLKNIIYKGSGSISIIYDNLIIPLPFTILNIAKSVTVIFVNYKN